jgi:hypothetical protein
MNGRVPCAAPTSLGALVSPLDPLTGNAAQLHRHIVSSLGLPGNLPLFFHLKNSQSFDSFVTDDTVDNMEDRMRVTLCASLLLFNTALALAGEQQPFKQPQARNASLTLYPGSRIHPEDLSDLQQQLGACSEDDPTTIIELATEVCLSGDYYLQNNFKLTELPICHDGAVPRMMFYPRRKCVGDPDFVDMASESREIPNGCAWQDWMIPNPSYYWSLIFRCGPEHSGAAKHVQAVPPAVIPEVKGPTAGRMKFYTGRDCATAWDRHSNGEELQPGSCRWPIGSLAINAVQIIQPPLCSNGARARLARFEDTGEDNATHHCSDEKLTFGDGLIDINDEDINTCIEMRDLGRTDGSERNANGVMFYCDGKNLESEAERTIQTTATVSHSFCTNRPWRRPEYLRPATFMEVEVEKCVNLPREGKLRLYKNGKCADGSAPRLASWVGHGCNGMPRRLERIEADMLYYCLPLLRTWPASYMFWCKGDGIDAEEPTTLLDNRAIYSVDSCPQKNGLLTQKQVGGLPPTLERIEPDVCIESLAADMKWTVYKSVICHDGTPAKLAVWDNQYCLRDMKTWRHITNETLGQCIQDCNPESRWCSVSIWCEGLPNHRGPARIQPHGQKPALTLRPEESDPTSAAIWEIEVEGDSSDLGKAPPRADRWAKEKSPVADSGSNPTDTTMIWWIFWAGGAFIGLIILIIGAILTYPYITDIQEVLKVSFGILFPLQHIPLLADQTPVVVRATRRHCFIIGQ